MADTPKLADLTFYNNRSYGGISPEEIGTARANDFLTALRQYDPNAAFTPVSLGDAGHGYQLQFDSSKLPGASGSGALGGANPGASGYAGGSGYMPNWSTVQSAMQLNDPKATTQSPVYGKITANSNIGGNRSWLDVAGPLAVLGFGAAFGGLPFLTQGITGSLPSGAGGGLLDTSGDSFLGLTNEGFPAFQGVPSAGLVDQPLGSAESSLYGPGALTNPETALGGSGAAPIIEQGTTARLGDILRANTGIDPSNLASLGKLGSGLLGLGGGGGGGGGLLSLGTRGGGSGEDITAMLRRFYGTDKLELAKLMRERATHG